MKPEPNAEPRPFEFGSAAPAGLHRALHTLEERSAAVGAAIRRAVPEFLRHGVSLNGERPRLIKTAELLKQLEEPPFYLPMVIDPGGSRAMLLFDAGTCGLLVEAALGGAFDLNEAPRLGTVTRAQSVALTRMAEAMSKLMVDPLFGSDTRLQRLPAGSGLPTEGELAVLSFLIGDRRDRRIFVAVSRDAVTSLSSTPTVAARTPRDSKIPNVLGRVDVELVVELGKVSRTLTDVANLRVGDLLRLDTPIRAPVNVLVQGRSCFVARPTTSGTMLAITILERTSEAARLGGLALGPADGHEAQGFAREAVTRDV
ncbi:MAG: FliM/FliN family flagellar motor switch protein [Polyangiaceae bacterium]